MKWSWKGFITVFFLSFFTYIIFTGSVRLYDIVTGIIASVIIASLIGRFLVEKDSKAFSPIRWGWAISYFFKYITWIEWKAHWDVIKRIFNGKIRPGIVKVPIKLKNEYARTLVANSITNTPGTVVVDVDKDYMYVNWIWVETEEPDKAKSKICEEFVHFAEKIFEDGDAK